MNWTPSSRVIATPWDGSIKQNLNDTALQVFRSLTATNPDNPTFHHHFAMVLLRKGDKATAKTELQNVLAKKPSAEMRQDVEKALSQIG